MIFARQAGLVKNKHDHLPRSNTPSTPASESEMDLSYYGWRGRTDGLRCRGHFLRQQKSRDYCKIASPSRLRAFKARAEVRFSRRGGRVTILHSTQCLLLVNELHPAGGQMLAGV